MNLLSEELLGKVNQLIIEGGHKLVKKKPDEPLRGRCDSFVVETDVRYPTDVSLQFDSMRCMIRSVSRLAKKNHIKGWRQWLHLIYCVKNLYNRVSTRARSSDERVEAYLTKCRELIDRVDCTLEELVKKSGDDTVRESSVQVGFYQAYAEKFIDQIDRRLLKGETIPQEEKVFSIFEEHTRWCSKGKAGKPVELGVPVCLIEDQYQFILHHKVMFTEHDVNVAMPIIEEAQVLHPDLRLCSFDRGFHSPGNRERLDELLELSAFPRKGRLSQADRERETDEEFVEARRQHPGIESAINALDH